MRKRVAKKKRPAAKQAAKASKAAKRTKGPVAAKAPARYRARVRMYRQGLGDCFLLTLPTVGSKPFQMLIDCGALARDKKFMSDVVTTIRDAVLDGEHGKARLDVVVGTHEHKDHLSGFNQARDLFNDHFDFGAVWLAWTENLTKQEVRRIKETKKKALQKLKGLSAFAATRGLAPDDERLAGIDSLLNFSSDDDQTGAGRIADAMEYLKQRGMHAGRLNYLEPGETFALDGVDGVRVYVFGPPKDPNWLKTSAVTSSMKDNNVIYHLAATGEVGIDALAAAIDTARASQNDRFYPFAVEHRITASIQDAVTRAERPNPHYVNIAGFLRKTYNDPAQAWRKIDDDWLSAFGQLALDLDNDTNNTSLVLAFEFVSTGEVLLFVADAQIGSWLSWGDLKFDVPGRQGPVTAADLLSRTVFYKVGHHCSHNATAKSAGLELMTREGLIGFIPLDIATAKNQGTKGWDMPAKPLYDALQERTGGRIVISDKAQQVPAAAIKAGVVATEDHIDYFLI